MGDLLTEATTLEKVSGSYKLLKKFLLSVNY